MESPYPLSPSPVGPDINVIGQHVGSSAQAHLTDLGAGRQIRELVSSAPRSHSKILATTDDACGPDGGKCGGTRRYRRVRNNTVWYSILIDRI
jgi:hypothetical protein